MIDDILLKSLSKKRWTKRLYEDSEQGFIEKRYKELLNYINSLDTFNNLYYNLSSMTFNIYAFVTPKPFVEPLVETEVENVLSDYSQRFYQKLSETSFNSFKGNIKPVRGDRFMYNSAFLVIYPMLQIQIDTRNMNYGCGGTLYYKSSSSQYNNTNDKVVSSEHLEKISTTDVAMLLNTVYEDLSADEALILDQEKLTQNGRLNTFTKDKLEVPEEDFIPREDGFVNIMAAGNRGSETPFIYTSQIISDSKPRTIENTSKELIGNLKRMKEKVQNSILYTMNPTITEGRRAYTDEEKAMKAAEKEAKTRASIVKKVNDLFKNDSKKEFVQTTTTKMLDAYIDSIEKASKGIFDQDYKNSSGIGSSLVVYQPEILSPYVVANLEGVWDSLQGDDGKKVFRETFHITGDKIPSEHCLIGYFDGMSEPLCDSYMFIRATDSEQWRKIGISTKGGQNGQGAAASITSIKDFIYCYTGSQSVRKKYTDSSSNWNLTMLGQILKRRYPKEFGVFELLTGNNFKTLKSNPSLLTRVLNNSNIEDESNIQTIIDYINDNLNMSGFIMDCLKSAAFEFIQLNSLPQESDKGLHYKWTAKYPAVFIGEVRIECPASSSGFTKFHIL